MGKNKYERSQVHRQKNTSICFEIIIIIVYVIIVFYGVWNCCPREKKTANSIAMWNQ